MSTKSLHCNAHFIQHKIVSLKIKEINFIIFTIESVQSKWREELKTIALTLFPTKAYGVIHRCRYCTVPRI